MRLINTETLQLEGFFDSSRRPPYAILSHTWGDDEVSLQEWEQLQQGDANTRARIKAKRGFKKIDDACRIAREDRPETNVEPDVKIKKEYNSEEPRAGYRWLWVDTNCIDKKSSAELSEAINSMFHWYQAASCCIVYLEDVSVGPDMDRLPKSRWFTRGWTLQELLAPPWAENVLFYNDKWEKIGSRSSLCQDLSSITGISQEVLLDSPRYRECSIAQRMSWASGRETTRVEDTAYCLLGLFDINMPLLYGEKDRAFRRLQEEIMKVSTDQTLFAWNCDRLSHNMDNPHAISILAPDPSYFRECGTFIETFDERNISEFTLTNVGLTMTLPLINTHDSGVVYAALNCRYEDDFSTRICVPLTTGDEEEAHSIRMFARNPFYLPSLLSISTTRIPEQSVKICIPRMSGDRWSQLKQWRITDLDCVEKHTVLLHLLPAEAALSGWFVESCFEMRSIYNVPLRSQGLAFRGCFLKFQHQTRRVDNTRHILVIMWSRDFSRTHVSFQRLVDASGLAYADLMKNALGSPGEASTNAAACDGLQVEVDFAQRRMIAVDVCHPDLGFMLPVFVDKISGGPELLDTNEPEDQVKKARPRKRVKRLREEFWGECEI